MPYLSLALLHYNGFRHLDTALMQQSVTDFNVVATPTQSRMNASGAKSKHVQ